VLDDGKVAGIGTHEELLAGCEVYRETHYSQFPKQEEPEKETRKQGSASDEEGLRSKQPSGGEKSQADLASDGKNSKRKRIRNGGDSRSKNTPGGKSASGDDFPGKAGQTKGVLA
ncbi:MAG: hypothetical protein LUF30_03050, partial [Lachnospiraceae bacterium]|nr:hypothetical protein [Lachnospiraceae bacterium]